MDRIASVLLDDPALTSQQTVDLEQVMVSIALQYVVPFDAGSIPVAEIIKVRARFAEERGLFQEDIRRIVGGITHLGNIPSIVEIEAQMRAEYDRTLGPRLKRLKDHLSNSHISTVNSALATSFALPGGVALATDAIGVAVTAAGGAALGVWTLWRQHQQNQLAALSPSPESYLYHVGETLTPGAATGGIHALITRLRHR